MGKKNWNSTIRTHSKELERLLNKIGLFDTWAEILHPMPAAKLLIKEMFMDAYMSVHFSGYGLYKYAHMCLRSEMETALRLVYFSTHPVEFNWWVKGNDACRQGSAKDVWGPGYLYFTELDEIKDFEKHCDARKRLFGSKSAGIGGYHKKLSKFIHSSAGHFQTRADRVSPSYNNDEFSKWYATFEAIQTYIHIILLLGFADKFKEMTTKQKESLLKHGVGSRYKNALKKALNL